MIEIRDVTKNFEDVTALDHITLSIAKGKIFGLFGTNGAGKSTLLRAIAGILVCDAGKIEVDGEPVHDNVKIKERFFYLPDDPYYFPGANMEQMAAFYAGQYPDMNIENVRQMADRLELDTKRPLRTFSKGMKRQAFLIMALCANTDYLLCDEVFDGLDPVVTEVMKNLFRKEIEGRELTIVIAAHKLQDIQDFCDEIGILHRGGIVLAGSMRQKSGEVWKVQCVFEDGADELKESLDILSWKQDGYFVTLMVRGEKEKILGTIRAAGAVFCREVPMMLEEVFIAEMEAAGYDIGKALQ